MSAETGRKPIIEEEDLLSIGTQIKTNRRTELKIDGPNTTEKQVVIDSVDKIRSACPLMGECALSATCTPVKYDERSPFGWMQTETVDYLRVDIEDDAVNCPTPNAHLEILDTIIEFRSL